MPDNSVEFFIDWLINNNYTIYKHNSVHTIYEAVNNQNTKKIVIFTKSPESGLILRASKDGGDTKQDFDTVDDCIRYLTFKDSIYKVFSSAQDSINKVKDKLNVAEHTITVQAIREDVKGEYNAIKQYEEHVVLYTDLYTQTQDKIYLDLIKITKDIITEEYTHVGELNELLNKVNPEEMVKFEEGVNEASEKLETVQSIADDERDRRERNEPSEQGKGRGTHLPYGLCKKYNIKLPEKATPKQAWAALKKEGITPQETYKSLEETGTIEQVKSTEEEVREKQSRPENIGVSKEQIEKEVKQEEQKEIQQQNKPTSTNETESKIKERADRYSKERKNKARWFTGNLSKLDSYKAYVPQLKEVWKNATMQEKEAVVDYTGGDYSWFNKPLRGFKKDDGYKASANPGEVDLNEFGKGKEIEALTKLLDKSTLEQDTWLQRGIDQVGCKALLGIGSIEDIDYPGSQLFLDTIITDYGFMSCSSSKYGSGYEGSDVILNIYCPKGTKALYVEPVSQYGQNYGVDWDGQSGYTEIGENETILQRGTQMKITKIEQNGLGQYFIDVEVLLND